MPVLDIDLSYAFTTGMRELAGTAAGGGVLEHFGIGYATQTVGIEMHHQQHMAEHPAGGEAMMGAAEELEDTAAGGGVLVHFAAGGLVRLDRSAYMTVDALGTVETVEPRLQKASVLAA